MNFTETPLVCVRVYDILCSVLLSQNITAKIVAIMKFSPFPLKIIHLSIFFTISTCLLYHIISYLFVHVGFHHNNRYFFNLLLNLHNLAHQLKITRDKNNDKENKCCHYYNIDN